MLKTADWIDFVGDADGVDAIVDLVALAAARRRRTGLDDAGGGGAEAARQILRRERTRLIVAVTSSDSLEALTEMISAGASCLVNKGGSASQLTQTIARALRVSAGTRARPEEAEPAQIDAPAMVADAAPERWRTGSLRVERLRAEFASTGLLGELVELFGSQTPERLVELREAIDARDAAAVSGHAHQLKGGCLTMAATRMAKLCDELERSSRAGSTVGAGRLADEIQVAFDQAYAALRQEVG